MADRNLSFTTAATTITIPTMGSGVQRLGIQVANNSGSNLTSLTLGVRCGKSTTYSMICAAAADYTTPVSPLVRGFNSPFTLTTGSVAFILLDCHGIDGVQLLSSHNVTAEVSYG